MYDDFKIKQEEVLHRLSLKILEEAKEAALRFNYYRLNIDPDTADIDYFVKQPLSDLDNSVQATVKERLQTFLDGGTSLPNNSARHLEVAFKELYPIDNKKPKSNQEEQELWDKLINNFRDYFAANVGSLYKNPKPTLESEKVKPAIQELRPQFSKN